MIPMGRMDTKLSLEPLTVVPKVPPLALLEDQTILLGPANTASMVRLMNYYQNMIAEGKQAPLGLLSKLIAERISNPTDRQDMLCGIFSPRGQGKSRSALYLCWAVSKWLETITGKDARTFFTGENVISLADGEEIAARLADIPDCSCLVVDDCGVGINARDFQSKTSKGILKIISTCRTKRLFLVCTAPSAKHIDVALRQMLALEIRVHKSAHSMGYNLLKANRITVSAWGQEYRNSIVGKAGKIGYWVCPNAPAEIVAEYDRARTESAQCLAQNVKEAVSTAPKEKINQREAMYLTHREKAREIIAANPKITVNGLAAEMCITWYSANYILTRMKKEIGLNG